MDKPEEIIRSVVSIANHKLIEAASRDIKLEGMGTTLVVATVVGNTVCLCCQCGRQQFVPDQGRDPPAHQRPFAGRKW